MLRCLPDLPISSGELFEIMVTLIAQERLPLVARPACHDITTFPNREVFIWTPPRSCQTQRCDSEGIKGAAFICVSLVENMI